MKASTNSVSRRELIAVGAAVGCGCLAASMIGGSAPEHPGVVTILDISQVDALAPTPAEAALTPVERYYLDGGPDMLMDIFMR